ncbi:AraC family transcriptional regulator [Pseudomaricurvus alkylphenolicus]|uniref:AraC family transcriptional regulator n=1 Tax=Pseudomaricurvus alkylphenolicus TaxID=1306991 RepID=UPI00141E71E6|nr:AraC family transcriptional regulator [Pseudomaricurvus alkylphenolicus]NIB38832.1 AraC family transcriptional regulator [Pseudomaricurvus alkylphenolicus]
MFHPVKIRYYLSVMQERGITPEAALLGSGINQERLDDADYLVDLSQCQIVVENMIRLTEDQGIGLDVGNRVNLADFGIIAHAMVSSGTLQAAAQHWVTFSNLTGMLINIKLEPEEEQWTIVYSSAIQSGFIFNFCVEEMTVAGRNIVKALTGEPLSIKEVYLSYPAPLHAEKYKNYFECPIYFNARRCAVVIRSPALSFPLPRNDEQLHRIANQHCRHILRTTGYRDLLVSKLRKLFLSNPGAIPAFEQAAEHLQLAPRTLRRRLLEEGTNYKSLTQKFRLELTTAYLRSRQLRIDDIAILLGYSDANAFRRAFKSWTGSTLTNYRKHLDRSVEDNADDNQ